MSVLSGAIEKVVVAVITAAILGGAALLWNWSSQGGLLRAIGGVNLADVRDEIQRQPKVPYRVVSQSFGGTGPTGPGVPYTEYKASHTGSTVTSIKEYPFCALSGAASEKQGCTVDKNGENWIVMVNQTGSCRVTCFKIVSE